MTFKSPYAELAVKFRAFRDERGVLTVVPAQREQSNLPFEVQRIFWITQVPPSAHRGMHAHRTCWEALVAVSGSFKVKVDNGTDRPETVILDSSQEGLLIPPMVWCELFDFSSDAVCLCLASGLYDKEGYICDYKEFKSLKDGVR